MANWSGASRSNYVEISDMEGLKAALEPFDIEISKDELVEWRPLKHCFLCGETNDGEWPSWSEDDDGNEIEFSFEEYVMPFVKEGEVLVTMVAGAEKLRYITGYAQAFIRRGTEVAEVSVSINDIYEKAAKAFTVNYADITAAEY